MPFFSLTCHRVRPEQGFTGTEQEPDFQRDVPVPVLPDRIFEKAIRFRFEPNRIFKNVNPVPVKPNRNSGSGSYSGRIIRFQSNPRFATYICI